MNESERKLGKDVQRMNQIMNHLLHDYQAPDNPEEKIDQINRALGIGDREIILKKSSRK
ncbi:hypothetical protein [Secundilactobacillus similis]|jgi:hypothetical protein|uniref:Uncharacterized protein n=1 Tax=Secundilactobacillus similis DSM 23365 = JCM 2765 TaxID=1423804 RepID=A0A0R2ETM6_9LACO|nr:hypothetical protein [Secundilactobacillus similis]KRN18539.1 hypothetical protein FD14_GL001862 [Secundilactobacillus similis DSM 23365 = JCM 2765]